MGLENLRVGIAGFGEMGQRHLEAVLNLGAQVAGVADLNPEALSKAEHLGVTAYASWEALLEMESPDALIIATNGPSHHEIALGAVSAGVRFLLCEKPMASSVEQADCMIKACQKARIRLAVNHVRRAHLGYQRLKTLLEEGEIGPLVGMNITCNASGLASVGCHFFDLMRFLSGSEPVAAVGWERSLGVVNPRGESFQDPGGFGVIRFQSHMRAYLDMSEDIGLPPNIEIVGTWGRILIDEPNNTWTVRSRSQTDRKVSVTRSMPLIDVAFDPGPPLEMIGSIMTLLSNLFSDDDILCTGSDGRESLAIYAGLRASMLEQHREVAFPLEKYIRNMEFPVT